MTTNNSYKKWFRVRYALVVLGALAVGASVALALAPARRGWSDYSTAAATAYCLAKHPYVTTFAGDYTPEGFEIARRTGIVGAVRRNFVFKRSSWDYDEGNGQTCAQACAQFAQVTYPTLKGYSLSQKLGDGTLRSSGIGDIASLAIFDRDFNLGTEVVAGLWSRSNAWHESDVTASDLCCCQVK